MLTKLFLIAGESTPRISLVAAEVKSAKPKTGKYSCSNVKSAAICCSTALTTGKTHGLLFSSLYAFMNYKKIKLVTRYNTANCTQIIYLQHQD